MIAPAPASSQHAHKPGRARVLAAVAAAALLSLQAVLLLLSRAQQSGPSTSCWLRVANSSAPGPPWSAAAAAPSGRKPGLGVVAVLLPPITSEWGGEETGWQRLVTPLALFADALLALGRPPGSPLPGTWPHDIVDGSRLPFGAHVGDELNAAAREARRAWPDARWLFVARADQDVQLANGSTAAVAEQLREERGSPLLLCRSRGGIDAQGCFFRLPLQGRFAGAWGVTFVPSDAAAAARALASPAVARGLTVSPAGVEQISPLGSSIVPPSGDTAPLARISAACRVVERTCCDGCSPPADGSDSWALYDIGRSLRAMHVRAPGRPHLHSLARQYLALAHDAATSRDMAAWAMYDAGILASEAGDLNGSAANYLRGAAARPSPELLWGAAGAKHAAGDDRGAVALGLEGVAMSCHGGPHAANCSMPAQSAYLWLPAWFDGLWCLMLSGAYGDLKMAAEAAAARAECSAAIAARHRHASGGNARPLVTGLQAVALARGAGDTKPAVPPSTWCPKAACNRLPLNITSLWELPQTPWDVSRPYQQLAAHPLLRAGGGTGAGAGLGGRTRCVGSGTPCSLLVAVPGMGGRMLDQLVGIFWRNKRAVEERAPGVFDRVSWQVVSYNTSQHAAVKASLAGNETHNASNVEVVLHEGLIASHLADAVRPTGYDFVLVLLDDVELVDPVDWRTVLALREAHDLDLVSACGVHLSASNYKLMWCDQFVRPHDVLGLLKVRAVELYASLYTGSAFARYQASLAPHINPTLHGPEAVLHAVFSLDAAVVSSRSPGAGGGYAFAFRHKVVDSLATARRYSDDEARANQERYYERLGLSTALRDRVLAPFFWQTMVHYMPG